jgi:hypothetical protein
MTNGRDDTSEKVEFFNDSSVYRRGGCDRWNISREFEMRWIILVDTTFVWWTINEIEQ